MSTVTNTYTYGTPSAIWDPCYYLGGSDKYQLTVVTTKYTNGVTHSCSSTGPSGCTDAAQISCPDNTCS